MKFQQMSFICLFSVFTSALFAMACGASGGKKSASAEHTSVDESTTLICRGELKITYSGSSGTAVIRGEKLDAQIEKDDEWLRVIVERQNKMRSLWVHRETMLAYVDTKDGNRGRMPLGECQTVDRETSKMLTDFAKTVMDSVGDEAKFVRLLPSEEQLMNLMTCEGENSLARQLVKQLPELKNRSKMNAVKFEYIESKDPQILRSFEKSELIHNCEVRTDFVLAYINVQMDGKDTGVVVIDKKPYFLGQR